MVRKYPIGLQSFREIREGGYLYIDKTKLIHRLADTGKYYFLSRPRRFGKSLLLDTIAELFKGSRDLFQGLWIENQWNWEKISPVIHLKLSKIPYQQLGLEEALSRELDHIASDLNLTIQADNLKEKFTQLIRKAATEEKVVILVDEYDKPVIDYIDNLPQADENRVVFKNFYSVLKDADEYIRFLLLTGVSRFSKVSIFSDLNNLNDITIHRHYATIAGITQQELEYNFASEIEELQQQSPDIVDKIRQWYNGYKWHWQEPTVYNPFSVLKFMETFDFQNYWFATGSPTFLVKLLKEKKEFEFDDIRESEMSMGSFYIENPLSASLLFQTGYLTIKSFDPDTQLYTLDYPNREVKASLLDNLLSAYREVFPGTSMTVTSNIRIALEKEDMDGILPASYML